MKIFISWSKKKSKRLAEETKKFILNVLGNSIDIFFSPEMYKGTNADNKIHNQLLQSDKCITCITSENYKNPWLMYEAGVIYGSRYEKTDKGIVIPILFEHIPEWSSWIDKPLNRYVPIQIADNLTSDEAKKEFRDFLTNLGNEIGIKPKNFCKNWAQYINRVNEILKSECMIPVSCRDLVDQLMNDNAENFTIISPEITKERILFHRGFQTNALVKLLLNNITEYQGKRLWIYGRRNKKLITSENDDFFEYLANEGIQNGVDFRCLFPFPGTRAMDKAVSKEKERGFYTDLQTTLEDAVALKSKFNLPVEKIFRLYKSPRKTKIVISDNALLCHHIICDSEGYPLPLTNSSFEVLDISDESLPSSKGRMLLKTFEDVWTNSIPLTKELYEDIYKS